MAYGQTGSGKTYTLMSPDGVAATIIEKSFRKMAAKDNLQYKVSMSYLQIYQEKIYDLLNNAASNKIDLTIREHPQKGIYVENLSEYVVRGPEEVHSLLQLGKKRLVFAETKMNRTSSRSHSVCILSIERSSKHLDQVMSPTKKHFDKKLQATLISEGVDTPKTSHHLPKAFTPGGESSDSEEEEDPLSKMMAFNEDVVLKGHLYICDLAGSERIKKTKAEGERLSEAQHINSSLLELGNVIQALAEGAESGRRPHIPFRNSTLTRLLQESLGGNCKTSLVVCCSPSDVHVHETKCSLNFGSRAMKVRNTAYVNVEMDYKKLSDDLAKLLDAKEKEIEELKVSRQHELELWKKEAEMAAEMKFGDGLNEAKRAYVALKGLLDTQASSHADSMSKLQAELSHEKDMRLGLQAELSDKSHSSEERQCRTKCLLLTEVLSMQLFYTLQTAAGNTENFEIIDQTTQEQMRRDIVETQEEVLENVDNLIGVLGAYLNLAEREFSNGGDLAIDSEEEDGLPRRGSLDGRVSGLQSLVVKIRKRLKILKDNVDGRTLRFLNSVVDRKDRASLENITDVYHILQDLLTARNQSTDPDFLHNSRDAEHCLTYVLLDKALLCCLLVLERHESERKFFEIGGENEALLEELEVVRNRHKSLKNDNDRLISQLERRRNDQQQMLELNTDVNVPAVGNRKAVEALINHNTKLRLEVDKLRKELCSKRGRAPETGKDIQLSYLRQQVSKLTRENKKLEFMMKIMGDRFSQGNSNTSKEEVGPFNSQKEGSVFVTENSPKTKARSSTMDDKHARNNLREEKVVSAGTSPSASVRTEGRRSVSLCDDGGLKEHLLTSKVEADKTLKQLFVIKEKIQHLDPLKSPTSTVPSAEPEKENLGRLLDTAIESVQNVGVNTGLVLNSSMEDVEALEKDINAMKMNNEELGRQCLSLVNDRQTLEALLSDLRSNIAGLQEKVDKNDDSVNSALPTVNQTRGSSEDETEITKDVFSCSTTRENPLKSMHAHKVNVHSWESESVKRTKVGAAVLVFTDKECQTDVSLLSSFKNDSESDGAEEITEELEESSEVVRKLTKKYCLVKQLVKHLEAEIRKYKIRTTALETELKERQHLKDANMLLEEEVKELQGLKIYLESQLAEESSETREPSDDCRHVEEESNLSKWKNYKERDSFSDLLAPSNLSTSTLSLTSTPNYKPSYESMSRSMMDLSQPQMYTSFSSFKSSRGSSGSLKMLKLEMEGQPSRIRDKLKSASLLLQHTGSLESQLKGTRQKCFRLEGEVCKLIKEKKELSEELDKTRAKLAEEAVQEVEFLDAKEKLPDESPPFGSITKRRSFRFKRGKEEKDRLKNELSLAKEQLSKLKSQLEMANPTLNDSKETQSLYVSLSEDEKRREKELALTRERCLILAEELGASNKEKIKLGDDLQEALDNIDVLATEIKRLNRVEEEKKQLELRVEKMESKLASSRVKEEPRTTFDKNDKELNHLKSDVVALMQEKSRLEESVTELRWEKDKLNEMENIVKRLMQVEKEATHAEGGSLETSQDRAEMSRLRKENKLLREELDGLKERILDLEFELEKSSENTSPTQVLSAVKDTRSKSEKFSRGKSDVEPDGAIGATRGRGGLWSRSDRKGRSTSNDRFNEASLGYGSSHLKEHKDQSRGGSEKKSRTKGLGSLFH